MWNTDTLWFDASVVLAIFAAGNIVFGHFEEHRPKWRRLLKVVIVLGVVLGLSSARNLKRRLEKLGYTVDLQKAA